MNRTVSIIVPNYNNAHWLKKCIDSCLGQGNCLKEIIIVDDHSTDDSRSILEEYQRKSPKLIKLYHNPGKGANQARNYGLEQCTGDFIQWLDSDDQLLDGKLIKQVDFMQNHDVDIAYSDWRIDYWDGRSFLRSESRKCSSHTDYLMELLRDNWTSPNNYLLKRSFAKKLYKHNAWNHETVVGQDREYFTLAGILGARFGYIPGEFAVYNKWSNRTISQKYKFKKILNQVDILLHGFRDKVMESDTISTDKRKIYLSLIEAQMIKGMFYDFSIRPRNTFSLFRMDYSIFHPKMKPIVPFIILAKNVQYLISTK